ncbi:MAG: sugar phosphate isomerase/epimerase [Myxococcales bacterium]|nr:MAG: sugar phosphate isomerase/epimerase [Myxococcales bacterium]
MPLDQYDLVLCTGTAQQVPFLERLTPARAAGYKGVSIQPHEHAQLRAAGSSDQEVRSRVADAGLAIAELDAITTWLPGHAPPASFPTELAQMLRGHTPERLVPIAASLGARSLTVVEFYGAKVSIDDAAEAFAGICDLAALQGLLVQLEFLPWAGIPDLRSGAEIVRRAGRSNGGLLIDSWHLFRSGSTLEELARIPGESVLGVQLNDAPERAEADLSDETQHRRLLPGQGSFDLVGLLRTLDRIGSRAPLGVEIFSDALAAQPIEAIARSSADATRRIVAAARS